MDATPEAELSTDPEGPEQSFLEKTIVQTGSSTADLPSAAKGAFAIAGEVVKPKPQKGPGSKGIVGWQRRLLPFMVGMLTLTCVFFLGTSYVQMSRLNQVIIQGHEKVNLDSALEPLTVTKDSADQTKLNFAMWRTLSLLEKDAMERRYHQASVMLMARLWTRYLGFITGMILSILGATFVLGKMQETESALGASSALWKLSLTTASPGIILVLLGTTLMLTTMLTSYDIRVDDQQIFTNVKIERPTATPYPSPRVE
jgi:hypothetical protein